MIKSMTGFGRCEITDGTRKYTVEMKSVYGVTDDGEIEDML